jgi:hypothetical protein
MSGSYRLVVCIDVLATDLEDAYGQVYENMKRISRPGLGWESSDEAFDPDGEQISEAELSRARTAYLHLHGAK